MSLFDGRTFDPTLDSERLSSQLERVKEIMSDGNWHTLGELASLTHSSEAGCSARLRDLKKDRFGGYKIQKERVGNPACGLWQYRLTPQPHFQFQEDGQGVFA